MGGKLSVAIAMLDGNNSGWIINAMHSREGCYTYVKEILKGESFVELAEEEAEAYIDEEKGVKTIADAVQGATDIIAEMVSDNAEFRNAIRNTIMKYGEIVSKAKDEEAKTPYENYYDYREAVGKIPGHRILAINRAEKEKVISVKIEMPDDNIIMALNKSMLSGQSISPV